MDVKKINSRELRQIEVDERMELYADSSEVCK